MIDMALDEGLEVLVGFDDELTIVLLTEKVCSLRCHFDDEALRGVWEPRY